MESAGRANHRHLLLDQVIPQRHTLHVDAGIDLELSDQRARAVDRFEPERNKRMVRRNSERNVRHAPRCIASKVDGPRLHVGWVDRLHPVQRPELAIARDRNAHGLSDVDRADAHRRGRDDVDVEDVLTCARNGHHEGHI